MANYRRRTMMWLLVLINVVAFGMTAILLMLAGATNG